MPGPLPKRVEERRRRNAVPGETVVTMPGRVKPPAAPRGCHPIARNLYNSLKASGQSQFFEPSDWQAARLAAEVTSRLLKNADRTSAQLFAAVWAAWDDLMTTEAARRRARLQVMRELEEASGADTPPTSFDEYRKALGQ